MYIFQGFVLLSLAGNIFAFLKHKKVYALAIGIVSPALIFFAFYIHFDYRIIYSGLFGLFVAGAANYIENRKCKTCQVS